MDWFTCVMAAVIVCTFMALIITIGCLLDLSDGIDELRDSINENPLNQVGLNDSKYVSGWNIKNGKREERW